MSDLHDPLADGIDDQAGGVFTAGLFEDVGAVLVDRTFRDEQFVGDLLVRQAAAYGHQDFAFAGRKLLVVFGRSTAARKNNESGQEQKDYKAELIEMFNNMDIYFTTKHKRYVASRYRNFFISVAAIATDKDYKAIYEGLISGDPKLRSYRALYQRIYGRYITEAKREEAKKNG